MAMSRDQEIAMLEKKLRKLKAKGEVKKKVGFVGGLKRSVKIFGDSAESVFKSLGNAGNTVLSDPQRPILKEKGIKKKAESSAMDIDSIIRGLPS